MNALFKALNDPTKLGTLVLLEDRDLNAGTIAAHFAISKPSISHHLDILKQADLVKSHKNGQFVTYFLNTAVMNPLRSWIITFKS